MKMKKWISGLLIILVLFVALIILTPTLLKLKGYDFIIGRYIPYGNDVHMIIYHSNVKDEIFADYINYENDSFIRKLSVGDKILILKPYATIRNSVKHNSIHVYYGIKLSDGDIEDIPPKMLRYINRDRIYPEERCVL